MGLRSKFTTALTGALLLVVPAAAGGTAPPRATAALDAATVSVVLKEWSVKASVRAAPAGKVTFVVRNAGKLPHEFLIVRTDKAPTALPVHGTKASVAGLKGRIASLPAGATKRLTLNLAAGKYVLLCNLPGHYKAGQATGFVVGKVATTSAPSQTSKVSVSAFEMGFKLSKTTVPHGTVVFEVRNDGKLPHDFSFGSLGGGTRMLGPGESATLTVSFPKPGKYRFICTVEGHMEGGMIGVLTVT